MKILSFVIPCFNSSAYMNHCIDTILKVSDDEIEVLIIDDGSQKDNTLEIAKEYEKKYPNICRAIHKENGGHGSVLNLGIKEATGEYLRVVDSDDWLDSDILKTLIDKMKELKKEGKEVDLFITNFIYDKVGQINKKEMEYKKYLPLNKVFTWDDIKDFEMGHYMLMHSLTYRTEVIRKSKLNLPEHTFYVDNIFAYQPLEFVNTMYYLNEPLYHYYIGRNDQSVNEKVMIGRLDQQYRVTYKMIDDVDIMNVQNDKQRNYMLSYLNIVMVITSILSILSNDEKRLEEKSKLWSYLVEKDERLNAALKNTFLSIGVNLPTALGRKISAIGYKIAQRLYGFN